VLYLVATPIGNLQDFSFRAVAVLKSCQYILCEDTRHSTKLLSHYDINIPLVSFHAFNEKARLSKVLDDLRAGMTIALLSDAGTPLIADPGFDLVRQCREHNLALSVIPGPSAMLCALLASSFDSIPFQFVGFLPRKKNERLQALQAILEYEGSSICYESPHRLSASLEELTHIDPTRRIAIARELTKFFENVQIGVAQELLQKQKEAPAKGEITLVIEGNKSLTQISYPPAFLKAKVQDYVEQCMISEKEALRLVAKEFGISRNALYQLLHE
jgi:16S rRNA (cytidine1402-2'-O)-methyltransferase